MGYMNRQERRKEWKRKEYRIRQHDMSWDEYNEQFIKKRPFIKEQVLGK
jgi:hypothetical protein